jgi:signal peptidase II
VDARRRRAGAVLFAFAGAIYVVDRLTKVWAEATLPGEPVELIPGVLVLRFTTNSGGAFSIGRSAPWFFVGVTAVVVVAILATSLRHTSTIAAGAIGSVLGGALGNLTDRAIRGPAFRGEVVDFIDVHVWPVFNVADSAIVAGAVVLAITGFRNRHDEGARVRSAGARPASPEP